MIVKALLLAGLVFGANESFAKPYYSNTRIGGGTFGPGLVQLFPMEDKGVQIAFTPFHKDCHFVRAQLRDETQQRIIDSYDYLSSLRLQTEGAFFWFLKDADAKPTETHTYFIELSGFQINTANYRTLYDSFLQGKERTNKIDALSQQMDCNQVFGPYQVTNTISDENHPWNISRGNSLTWNAKFVAEPQLKDAKQSIVKFLEEQGMDPSLADRYKTDLTLDTPLSQETLQNWKQFIYGQRGTASWLLDQIYRFQNSTPAEKEIFDPLQGEFSVPTIYWKPDDKKWVSAEQTFVKNMGAKINDQYAAVSFNVTGSGMGLGGSFLELPQNIPGTDYLLKEIEIPLFSVGAPFPTSLFSSTHFRKEIEIPIKDQLKSHNNETTMSESKNLFYANVGLRGRGHYLHLELMKGLPVLVNETFENLTR